MLGGFCFLVNVPLGRLPLSRRATTWPPCCSEARHDERRQETKWLTRRVAFSDWHEGRPTCQSVCGVACGRVGCETPALLST